MTGRSGFMPKPAANAAPASAKQPLVGYATLIALGLFPTALVTRYYDILPNRVVIRWDMFGNTTIIGTRSYTLLMIANLATVTALIAIAIAIWQHRQLIALGARRAFLGLNLAQIVAINLTCAMVVTDALGLQLTIKPAIAPAMAVLVFAAAVLFRRMDQPPGRGLLRVAWIVCGAAAVLLLVLSAVAANAAVGYYASAFAVLAMVALALPASTR